MASRVKNGTRKRHDLESGRDCARCGDPISKDTNLGYGVANPSGSGGLCQSCGNEVI